MSSAAESGGTPVVRWSSILSGRGLWAVGVMSAIACGIIGALALNYWRDEMVTLQIVSLLSILVGFAVMMWGFWGGVASSAAGVFVAMLLTVIAGRWSLSTGVPFERTPLALEAVLFLVIAYLCTRFIEREEVEETADRRQLDRLEEEYLDLAVRYGNREDLLKVLRRKEERLNRVDAMSGRLREGVGGTSESVAFFLDELVEIIGKGEAEVTLYPAGGAKRYSRGAAPADVAGDLDEIDRWLEAHQTALLVSNLTNDMRFTTEFGRSREVVSVMAVPLVWEGVLKGTLRITSVVPQAFSHEDLRFVSAAAGALIPALLKGDAG